MINQKMSNEVVAQTNNNIVQLDSQTVKDYLVSGNGKVTDQEVRFFIELCKSQNLNPFIREAYLIKFGNNAANIVVGKDVFTKRAYNHPDFEGMKSGIVVLGADGDIKYREGALKLPNEQLIGGWCEVYLKSYKIPVRSEVSLEEYDKNQSLWKTMKATMIRKVALVTALREAFPDQLQGLYDSSEIKSIPDKLPEKEVIVGMATASQKQGILKMAALKGLYDYNNPKNIQMLIEFLDINGYNLKELKYDEVDGAIKCISEFKEIIKHEIKDFKNII